jgi:hypothetical protein
LNFGGVWGVAIGPNGLQYVSLANTFRAWVRLLFNTIEMQNALDNDYTIRIQALTRGEHPMDESPYKTQMLIEIHQRFMLNYRSGAMGDQLHNLWAATAGLCDPGADVRWMQNTIDTLQQSEEGQIVERLGDDLAERLANLIERNGASDGPSMMQLAAYCDLMEDENKRFLNELKLAMREGVRVFEEYEQATIDQGNGHLQQAIKKIPGALEAYYARMFAGVQAIERQNG